jgi:ABC-type proline/glycine betaine transport system substrate-binding protein
MMADGSDGAIMAASIFDLNKTLLGTVSITFDPAELLNNVIASLLKDTSYAVTVSQLDSKIVYDTDPSQQGKVLFDPISAKYRSSSIMAPCI